MLFGIGLKKDGKFMANFGKNIFEFDFFLFYQ